MNHAGDLIKKRLIRTNPTPDKALRFSHLYSRLLAAPVLNQKWAILYFLYQLTDSEDASLGSSHNGHEGASSRRDTGDATMQEQSSRPRSRRDDKPFDDAFAPDGLPRVLRPLQTATESIRQESRQSQRSNGHKPDSPSRNTPARTTPLPTNRSETDQPENALLRDLPFTLQGLTSTNLQFSSKSTLRIPPTLPPPVVSVLYALAEPSLLYKGLEAFVHSSEPGLLGQSLRAAIGDKLRSYLKLIAGLEGQIRQTLAGHSQGESGLRAGVTLKKLVVATREPTRVLRLLSLIAEESKCKSMVWERLPRY